VVLEYPWVIYAMVTERWPVADLNLLQAQITNGYYFPKLTIAIVLLGTAIAAFLVGLFVDLVTRKGPFRRKPPQG
jgi:hypothetical protein